MKTIMLFALLLLSGLAVAQQEHVHRYMGIGFKLTTFQTSDLDFNYPINRLMLSCDPIKYARVDAQFGFHHTSEEITSPSSEKFDLKNQNGLWMVGGFGQYWFDDMLMYGGFRYGMVNYSTDGLYFVNSNWAKITSKGKVNIVAPAVGGEYRFGSRFSVGAEISFVIANNTFQPENGVDEMPEEKSRAELTETSAFFRFFPF